MCERALPPQCTPMISASRVIVMRGPCQGIRDPPPRPAMHWKGGGTQRRLDRRLEEVAKAVGGGYCQLQMPLRLALGVRGTVAVHRLGALERGGGYLLPHSVHPPTPLGGGGWGFRRMPWFALRH